jgi:hypothetical protein
MAYGKIKADAIIYDDSGSDVEKTIAVLASAASTASPTFTGDVTLTGAAANVVFDASDNALEFADNAKASFGNDDFQVVHDGSNTYVKEIGTGSLIVWANAFYLKNAAGDESMISAAQDGAVNLLHNNSTKISTTAAGVTVNGSVTDDKGNVRLIPNNHKTASYTLLASDAGKNITTDSGVTIPASVLAAGSAVTIINASGSDITLTQGSGLNLYNTADASTGNRTLAARGMATVLFASSQTTAYISGAGLS